jgi:hypothetical protein
MKYKPGDKVKIKSLDWYNANKNSEGTIIFHGFRIFDENMSEFCGKVVTIESYNSRWYYYDIKEDEKVNFWYDEMFEDPAIEEEPQEKVVSLDDVCRFLDEHLYTGTSTGDYDYGQEYIYSDFNNASDLIFALRKAMGE